MPEQQYEYHVLKLEGKSYGENAQEQIQAVADDGWRLVERIDVSGTTAELIFERSVE